MNPETTKAEVIKQVQTQYAVDNARQLIEVSGQQDRIKAKARQRTTNNLSSFVRSIDQTPTLRAQAQNISPPHTLQTPILLSPHQPLTDTTPHTRTSPNEQKINEHCFQKCVPKPSTALSSGEQTCFTQCMEKYMSAWNQVSATYTHRLQQGPQ